MLPTIRIALLLVSVLIIRRTDPASAGEQGPSAGPPRRFALLVGCTKYSHFPNHDLDGPANDVLLMRETLVERFHFESGNIVTLSERAGRKDPHSLPTRGNIEREFQKLAHKARSRDNIVIFLAGHGSQQPHSWLPNATDLEPDGLDETFIPSDARFQKEKEPPGDANRLINVIVDNELHDWAANITKSGASLWMIFDCCCSGTLLREPGKLKMRRLDTRALGMEDVLEKARAKARNTAVSVRGSETEPSPSAYDSADLTNVAAIYAAQSFEPEFEFDFDTDASETPGAAKTSAALSGSYGLLTYTLCQVLQSATASHPLTYRQVINRVRLEYARRGRTFPSPCLEGKDADREVLALTEWPNEPEFELRQNEEGALVVNAGKIQGLTDGSILDVFGTSIRGQKPGPLGHARIRSAHTLFSEVEPCDAGGNKVAIPLRPPALCKPARVNHDKTRIRLFVESGNGPLGKVRGPATDSIGRGLRKLTRHENSLVQMAERASSECWRIQIEGDQFYLVAPQGDCPDPRIAPSAFGPFREDQIETIFKERLAQIARVTLLKSLARPPETQTLRSRAAVDVEIGIVRHRTGDSDEKGHVDLGGPNGLIFTEGEWISFRVTNRTQYSTIYVTLLFIDSGYGVHSLYPGPGEVAERLNAGNSFETRRFHVNAKTTGRESLVTIAVRATNEPIDFSLLEQSTIQKARSLRLSRGSGEDPFGSPLGRLIAYGVYGEGADQSRSLAPQQVDDYVIDLIPWTTRSKLPDGPRSDSNRQRANHLGVVRVPH